MVCCGVGVLICVCLCWVLWGGLFGEAEVRCVEWGAWGTWNN